MDIFITSTGSGSGKTVVGAGIAAVMQSLGYEMGIYKPIQTGCKYANNKQFSPDLNFVKKIDPNIKTYSSYNFKQNALPPIAADLERLKISTSTFQRDFTHAKRENDIVITEGTGGLYTPITSRLTIANIVAELNIPLVIIANVEKDFINKILMTIRAGESTKLNILGIILNKYSFSDEKSLYHSEVKLLESMIDYEILGCLPDLEEEKNEINPENLISKTLQHINFSKVFNMEIPKLNF